MFDLIVNRYSGSIHSVFSQEITLWRLQAKFAAAREAIFLSAQCDTVSSVLKKTISSRGKRITPNVTSRSIGLGFVLGNTSFLRGYEIDIEVDCCDRVFQYSGDIFFSIRDWFRDSLDLGIEVGGTPYRITADWSEHISGGGALRSQ